MGVSDYHKNKDEKGTDSEKGKAAQNPLSKERDEEQKTSDEVTSADSDKSFKPKDRKPAPSHGYYEIQEGDSLSRIAKDHYGDASRWKLIYEKNKKELKSPDSLRPGQVIELPDVEP